MVTRRTRTDRRVWLIRQILFWLGTTIAVSAALVFSFPNSYDLGVGDVAPRDIRAPRDTSYVSEIRSKLAQDEAVRQVRPIYVSAGAEVARQQYTRAQVVLAYLRALRADQLGTDDQRYAWMVAVPELHDLPRTVAAVLLSLPEASWNRVQLSFLDLLDQLMRQEDIREDSLEGLRSRIPSLVGLGLAQDEAVAVEVLVTRFVVPNEIYDEAATETAREEARASVGQTFRTLRAGEIFIRQGSVLSDLDVEALEELSLTSQSRDWVDIGEVFLLSALLVLALGLYLWRVDRSVLDAGRAEALVLAILLFFLVLAWILLRSGDLLPYLFPGAAAAMLIAATVGAAPAVGVTLLLGAVCGWISGGSLDLALMVTLGALAAALTLPRYEQTGSLFGSGLLGGLVQAAVLFITGGDDTFLDPVTSAVRMAVSLGGGLLSGGLTIGLLFLLAPLFDLVTTFRLTELSRPSHPLLQRMLREAPGSFNHVMVVASMAEQAAQRIGTNALLTRVGAYYHDIGKLLRPYFFTENQQGLSNPHDRLDPYSSVDVVSGHIRDGIKLARQYRLPSRVVDFIPEHHGTMRISFFYQKAVEAAGGEASLVDEAQFRYPGPAPQSRETLLVMLADGCEAASRARRPNNPTELAEVVEMVFQQRIRQGQLDQCPITMEELAVVKQTYIDFLRGAYHPRVQYPEPTPPKQDERRAQENQT